MPKTTKTLSRIGVIGGASLLCAAVLGCLANAGGVFNYRGGYVDYRGDYVLVNTDVLADQLILYAADSGQWTNIERSMAEYGVVQDFEDHSVIIGGRLASHGGRLARYTRTAQGSFVLDGTYDWSNGHAIGLAYRVSDNDPGTLYLLDLPSREIRFASYTLGNAIPSTWRVLCSPSTAPILASSDLRLCDLQYSSEYDRIVLAQDYLSSPFAWIHPVTGQAEVKEGWNSWPAIDDSGTDILVGATSVPIEPTAASVQIVRYLTPHSWAVIGSSPTGTSPVSVTPLAYGDIVSAKRSDLPLATPPIVAAIGRVGVAQALNPTSTIQPLARALGLAMHIDNDAFSVSVWLDHTDPENVPCPTTYSAVCVVGIPTDLVVWNGVHVLDSTKLVPVKIDVCSRNQSGFGTAEIPIGDDQNLVGLVFSFQYWIDNGAELRVSDIASVIVRPEAFVRLDPFAMLRPTSTRTIRKSGSRKSGRSTRLEQRLWSRVSREAAMKSLLNGTTQLQPQRARELRNRLQRQLRG